MGAESICDAKDGSSQSCAIRLARVGGWDAFLETNIVDAPQWVCYWLPLKPHISR